MSLFINFSTRVGRHTDKHSCDERENEAYNKANTDRSKKNTV